MGGPSGKKNAPAVGYCVPGRTSPVTSSAPLLPFDAAVDHLLRGRGLAALDFIAGGIVCPGHRRVAPTVVEIGEHAMCRRGAPARLGGGGGRVGGGGSRIRCSGGVLRALPACHRTRPRMKAPTSAAAIPAAMASARLGCVPSKRKPLPCMRRTASRKKTSVTPASTATCRPKSCRMAGLPTIASASLRQVIRREHRRDVLQDLPA